MYSFEEIRSKLKEKDILPSNYRIKILKYLLDKKNHATVDIIYNDMKKDMPSMSKTTVYNTLQLLVEKDLIQLITIEEGETRYDADVTTHGHFKCTSCGDVYDFDIEEPNVIGDSLKGFIVEEKHIYYKGKCVKCI